MMHDGGTDPSALLDLVHPSEVGTAITALIAGMNLSLEPGGGSPMVGEREEGRAFQRSMGRWGACGCMPLLFAAEVSRSVSID